MRSSSSRAKIDMSRKDAPRENEAAEVADEFSGEPLEGYLQKRHQSGPNFLGSEWAKRWVYVNDEKGRMHVGKKKKKDGDTVFSLSDVDTVEKLLPEDAESHGHFHCFRVTQPPMAAVLQCETAADCQKWIDGIEARIEYWRAKRIAEGLVVAVTQKSLGTRRRGLPESPSFGTGFTGAPGSDSSELAVVEEGVVYERRAAEGSVYERTAPREPSALGPRPLTAESSGSADDESSREEAEEAA